MVGLVCLLLLVLLKMYSLTDFLKSALRNSDRRITSYYNTSWGLDWDSKVQSLTIISINIDCYMAQQGSVFGCPYWSGSAAYLLFMFVHLVPAAVVFTQGGHAKDNVSSGEATAAAGPAVVNWLITEKKR